MRQFITYLLLIPLNLLAQTALPVYKDGKWGLINENGQLIVQYQYEEMGASYEDCFTYRKDSLWYFTNVQNELNSKGYHDISFYQELIIAKHSNTKEVFTLTGKKLMSASNLAIESYDTIIRFVQGDEKKIAFNTQNNAICNCEKFGVIRPNIYECYSKDSLFIVDSTLRPFLKFSKTASFQNLSTITVVTDKNLSSIYFSENMALIDDSISNKNILTTPLLALILTKNNRKALYSLQSNSFLLDYKFTDLQVYQTYMKISTPEGTGILSLTGEVLVPPKYENVLVGPNSYRVSKDGLYGIYKDGDLIIPCKYTNIWESVTGYRLFQGSNEGYASKSGTIIEKPKYKRVIEYEGSILCIKKDSGCVQFLVDQNGHVLGDKLEFDKVMLLTVNTPNNQLGFTSSNMDTTGWVTIEVKPSNNRTTRTNRIAYKDSTGKQITPAAYSTVQKLSSNYELANGIRQETHELPGITFRSIKIDLWDIWGERFIAKGFYNFNFSDLTDSTKVATRINYNTKFGLLNKASGIFDTLSALAQYGTNYLACKSDHSDFIHSKTGLKFNDTYYQSYLNQNYSFGERNAYRHTFRLKDVKYGVYDSTLKLSIPIIYDALEKPINNTVIATLNGKQGLISLNNEPILPRKKWKLNRFRSEHDSLLLATEKAPSEVYIVDEEFNMVDHSECEIVYKRFNQEYLFVHKGNLFGVIDNQGNQILPITFSRIKKFKKGHAIIREGKYSYIINKDFQILNQQGYRKIIASSSDYLVVDKRGLKHILNYQGDTLMEETRRQITPVSNGWICHLNNRSASIYINEVLYKEFVEILYAHETEIVYSIKKKSYVLNTTTGQSKLIKAGSVTQCNKRGYIISGKDGSHFFPWTSDSATYSSNSQLSFSQKGDLILREGGKDILVDSSGNNVLSRRSYEYKNLLIYRSQGKLCIHNRETGTTLKTAKINAIIGISNDIILCQLDDYKYYNLNGEPIYNEGYSSATPFYSNFAMVTFNGKRYLLNTSGSLHSTFNAKKIVPAYANYFHLYPLELLGLYNDKGEELLPIRYHSIKYVGNNIVQVTFLNQLGYYNIKTKTWIKKI